MDNSAPERKRTPFGRTAGTLIAALGCFYGLLAWAVYEARIPADFVEYWSAGRAFLSGLDPYSAGDLLPFQRAAGWSEEAALMMWNPPWTLTLVVPFALLPFWPARLTWFLLNFSILLIAGDRLWKLYGGDSERRWISWGIGPLFYPAALALYLGQISPLLLAGVAGFLLSVSRNRFLLAGLFAALVSLKPHFLYLFWIFLILWIVKQRNRAVIMGGLLALILLSVPVIVWRPDVFRLYFEALNRGEPLLWQTPTLGVAFLKIFPEAGDWLRFLPSVLGMVLGIHLWLRWHVRFEWTRHLPSILLLSAVTTSFGWTFDLVVLLPVLIALVANSDAGRARRRVIWGILALVNLGILLQSAFVSDYFFQLWLVPALAMLYWWAKPELSMRG